MLSRTLSRQGAQTGRRRWRPFAAVALVAAAVVGLYLLVPTPQPRAERSRLTPAELLAAAASLSAPAPPAAPAAGRARAALGRALFADTGLSANGAVSCATCHDPQRDFTDGKPRAVGLAQLTKNSPSVVNTYLNSWFFWDGRADSLAAQALKPIEDPREHGSSRLAVVVRLRDRYRGAYEAAFGAFPAALAGPLPLGGLPSAPQLKLAIDVSAYALATLGRFSLLDDILKVAQDTRRAPAMELSRRAFDGPAPSAQWLQDYAALPAATQAAVDQVFANFGRAVAAYEAGLAAIDSPFDRFAARAAQHQDPGAALDASFGEKELAGLALFAGPGRCTLCHAGPNFTDQQFHNPGLAQGEGGVDVGRAAGVLRVLADPFNCQGRLLPPAAEDGGESCRELPFLATANLELIGAFKTPSLRNVARTAPYMHDGRFATLAEVLRHYNEQDDKPATGHREESLTPLDFSADELAALEAFLASLTSPVRDYNQLEVGAAKAAP